MITCDFASGIRSAFPPVTLLAMVAAGCGSVVVESKGGSSESAGSTASGLGGASAGAGSASGGAGTASGGTASTGTGGPTDCSAPNVTLLVAGQARPVDIALDATSVYWVNNGGDNDLQTHVFSMAKIGGGLKEIAAVPGTPFYLFVDDTYVYFSAVASVAGPKDDTSTLYAVPKGGGPSTSMRRASFLLPGTRGSLSRRRWAGRRRLSMSAAPTSFRWIASSRMEHACTGPPRRRIGTSSTR